MTVFGNQPPRLWGTWTICFYGSGTTIVCQADGPPRPWLYIYSDAAIDESRYLRDRVRLCEEIQDYMNGHGPRPKWIDDFARESETRLESLSGGSIHAVGPMIDRNPPNLDWVQDNSEQAADDRARLIDALVFKAATEQAR